MQYDGPILKMDDNSVTDCFGTLRLEDLPEPKPDCNVPLDSASPLMQRLWKIALGDVEYNFVETEDGKYLGAGTVFGVTVFTRDISYSGVLGLNALYPEMMRRSLKLTRKVRQRLGFKVAKHYAVREIDVPWQEEEYDERAYKDKYNTNSYTRRTDDVVWLYAYHDLLERHPAEDDEWQYMYEMGQRFFEKFYEPFFDTADGLFKGQASFIDIAWENGKNAGYPQDFTIARNTCIKATSTNCLYYRAMRAMKAAAKKLGHDEAAAEWSDRAMRLKTAIQKELRFEDGTLAYYKDVDGKLEPRREALGAALAVLFEVVEGDEARKALKDYPVSDAGVPLMFPFYDDERFYHNNSAWPFVDTFFLWACEKATGEDRTAENAALLARTCAVDGTFHELVNYQAKEISGSGHQLWSAAGFVNLCQRAGLA